MRTLLYQQRGPAFKVGPFCRRTASADQWLGHLATQPFFASTTLFIITAIAA
jgi:hypothetical protein